MPVFLELKDKIARRVAAGRLREAFSDLRSTAAWLNASDVADEAEKAEESYRLMLDYAAKGADDPHRDRIAADLGEKILTLLDRLERRMLRPSDPSLYFSTLRFEGMQRGDTLESLLAQYTRLLDKEPIFDLLSGEAHTKTYFESLCRREGLEKRLFNRLWVSYPLQGVTAAPLRSALTSDAVPDHFKALMIGALLMGSLQYHDPKRLEILMEVYAANPQSPLALNALLSVLLILHRWKDRSLTKGVKARLDAMREVPLFVSDLHNAYISLARTRDTDRIANKMRTEIYPDLQRLSPDLAKKFTDDADSLPKTPEELEDMEENNPAWEDIIENTGLGEKLREISELQSEGGDIMMSAFSSLKNFPFFSDVANWFLPFHTTRSEILAPAGNPEEGNTLAALADTLRRAPMLCDNDKWSMLFTYGVIPAQHKKTFKQALHNQSTQEIEDAIGDLITDEMRRKSLINYRVQSLYRFFCLYRRKGEFYNPFAEGVNLVAVPALRADLADGELLSVVGEFYFQHKYYPEALEVFKELENLTDTSAALCQKIGHILSQLGDLPGAIARYEKADMLGGGDAWTLRRLGRAYQAARQPELALATYRRLEAMDPDNFSTALLVGHALVEMERYDEAVKAYYKAEYLKPDSAKAARPLAWCLLMVRDFATSRRYYERLLSGGSPTPEDYLNMGHLSLAEGNFRDAVNFYSLHLDRSRPAIADPSTPPDLEAFFASMRADTPALIRAGVDPSLIPLVTDSLLYSLNL